MAICNKCGARFTAYSYKHELCVSCLKKKIPQHSFKTQKKKFKKLSKKEKRKLNRKLKQRDKPLKQIAYKREIDPFYSTYEWAQLRYKTLLLHGKKCQCCRASPPDVRLNVDHIKNRRDHPELALDIKNTQVLCELCNKGKGNWDSTDHRKPELRLVK